MCVPNTPPTFIPKELNKKEDLASTSHTSKVEPEVKIESDDPYIDLWGFHRPSGIKFEPTGWELETLFNIGDRDERHEEEICIPRNETDSEEKEYQFPIRESGEDTKMKNINPSILPLFYGLPTEDTYTFLFEFEVLCQTYEYKNDAQKLRLFPSTLKDVSLRWFMGLQGGSIGTWQEMKKVFSNKYKDYFKSREIRDKKNSHDTKG